MPLAFVIQAAVPLAPLVHLPITVAFATGFSAASWMVIMTIAFHFVPDLVVDRSRSPTCSAAIGSGVEVKVGAGVGVNVGNGVGMNVGSGVDVAVGSGVDVAVGSGVDVAVGGGVDVAVGAGVGVEVDPPDTSH